MTARRFRATAYTAPPPATHDRDVLRMGRYMALAQDDAAWLWTVVNNLTTAGINPECAYFKRASADYDAAALRVRLYTERLLAKLAGRTEAEGGEPFERYTGRIGLDSEITVEFHRGFHFVTAKID